MSNNEEKSPSKESAIALTDNEPHDTTPSESPNNNSELNNSDNKQKKKHRHKDRPRDPESEERRRIRKEKKRKEREEREKQEKEQASEEIKTSSEHDQQEKKNSGSNDENESNSNSNDTNPTEEKQISVTPPPSTEDESKDHKPAETVAQPTTEEASSTEKSEKKNRNSQGTSSSNNSGASYASNSNMASGSTGSVGVQPKMNQGNSQEKRTSKEMPTVTNSPKEVQRKKSLFSRFTDLFHSHSPNHPHDDPKKESPQNSPNHPSRPKSSDTVPIGGDQNRGENDTDSINLSESPANLHGNSDDNHKDSSGLNSNSDEHDGKRDSSDKRENDESEIIPVTPNKETAKPVTAVAETRVRQLRFPCSCVEDLPKDLKKIVRSTRLPDEVFDKDLQALLNILHFVTKKVYITTRVTPGTTVPATASTTTATTTTPSNVTTTKVQVEEKPETDVVVGTKAAAVVGGETPVESKGSSSGGSGDKIVDPETLPESQNTKAAVPETPDTVAESSTVTTAEHKEEKKVPENSENTTSAVNSSSPVLGSDTSDMTLSPVMSVQSPPSTRTFLRQELKTIEAFIIKNKNPKDLFKSLKKSGRGGFGTVFAAKNAEDGKKVAIKRVKHTTPKERMDNINEVRYAMRCGEHPNIVKLKQVFEWKEECWMVMEFLEGGTLTEARRGHEWEEKEIAYVARELLRGLAHIHKLNLVHRDVKSENIMMSILGDIKLIDFGLCSDNSLIRPCMVGSPYWMPPEMLNRRNHSFPCDIWSFGISLLELANKNPPNAHNKIKVMFTTATIGKPTPFEEPQKWSDDFKDFIGKCLAFDPSKRPSADELLKHNFIAQAANTRKVMRKILSEIFLQKAIGLM